MIEPVLSAEAVLKEALIAALKPDRTRFYTCHPRAEGIVQKMRQMQAARLIPRA